MNRNRGILLSVSQIKIKTTMKKKQTSLQIYYFGGNSKKEYVTQNLYDNQFKNMFYLLRRLRRRRSRCALIHLV